MRHSCIPSVSESPPEWRSSAVLLCGKSSPRRTFGSRPGSTLRRSRGEDEYLRCGRRRGRGHGFKDFRGESASRLRNERAAPRADRRYLDPRRERPQWEAEPGQRQDRYRQPARGVHRALGGVFGFCSAGSLASVRGRVRPPVPDHTPTRCSKRGFDRSDRHLYRSRGCHCDVRAWRVRQQQKPRKKNQTSA